MSWILLVVTLPLLVAIFPVRVQWAIFSRQIRQIWIRLVALGCNFTSASFRIEILVFRIRISNGELNLEFRRNIVNWSNLNDVICWDFDSVHLQFQLCSKCFQVRVMLFRIRSLWFELQMTRVRHRSPCFSTSNRILFSCIFVRKCTPYLARFSIPAVLIPSVPQ